MSSVGPARAYLEDLRRELRVGRRYRQRVLEELAYHIEEAAAREQRLGLNAEDAQRRAIERVGPVHTVAERFSTTRRVSRVTAQERSVRFMAYLGACVVLMCASLAPLIARDSDGHLGLELSATLAAFVAVLLLDLGVGTAKRVSAVLAGAVGAWIAAAALLVSNGEVLFCAAVFGGVLAARVLLSVARRLSLRPRREQF